MATKNRVVLKTYFETDKRPIQEEFEDLIDSNINIEEDKATEAEIDAGTSNDKYVTVLGSKRSARKSITVNSVPANLITGNIQLPPSEVPLTFGVGLTRTANSVSVNNEQVINKITNLAAIGYVKTNATNGTLSVSSTIPATDLTGTLPSTVLLGNASGASLAVTGNITSSAGAIGYTAGNGGTFVQLTNKTTTVILDKLAGDITLVNTSIPAGGIVSFTLTNNKIAVTDIIHLQHQNIGTFGAYTLNGRTAAGSAIISIRNNSAGALAEPIVIRFIVIKSAIS